MNAPVLNDHIFSEIVSFPPHSTSLSHSSGVGFIYCKKMTVRFPNSPIFYCTSSGADYLSNRLLTSFLLNGRLSFITVRCFDTRAEVIHILAHFLQTEKKKRTCICSRTSTFLVPADSPLTLV